MKRGHAAPNGFGGGGRGLPALLLYMALVSGACDTDRTHADVVEADARGVVTQVEADALQVEADPAEPDGSMKTRVHLSPETLIRDAQGRVRDASALRVGQRVAVWYEGEVMESYPTQGMAREIVIEVDTTPEEPR
jgi:hypothetical protein